MRKDLFVVHAIDPDHAIIDALAILLETYGIEVAAYPDAETFLASWSPQETGPCCLLCEADLPGLSGSALLRELRDRHIDLPVLLLANAPSPVLAAAVERYSHAAILSKPFLDNMLMKTLLNLRDAA